MVRLEERQGLIRARVRGTEEARGSVVTFLDSHCEVVTGWLEPLLSRIKMVCRGVWGGGCKVYLLWCVRFVLLYIELFSDCVSGH